VDRGRDQQRVDRASRCLTNAKPETKYAKSGDVHIAYQVAGEGPFDLIYLLAFVSNVEMTWKEPSVARYSGRLASFSRLTLPRGAQAATAEVTAPTEPAKEPDLVPMEGPPEGPFSR
jgi:hypothetical protein